MHSSGRSGTRPRARSNRCTSQLPSSGSWNWRRSGCSKTGKTPDAFDPVAFFAVPEMMPQLSQRSNTGRSRSSEKTTTSRHRLSRNTRTARSATSSSTCCRSRHFPRHSSPWVPQSTRSSSTSQTSSSKASPPTKERALALLESILVVRSVRLPDPRRRGPGKSRGNARHVSRVAGSEPEHDCWQ